MKNPWSGDAEVAVNEAGRGKKGDGSLFRDLACHRRFLTEASDWNLGFRGGRLHAWSESSAAEPGEGHMGDVG